MALIFGSRHAVIAPEAKSLIAQSVKCTRTCKVEPILKLISRTLNTLHLQRLSKTEWGGGSVCFSSLNYPENDVRSIAASLQLMMDGSISRAICRLSD